MSSSVLRPKNALAVKLSAIGQHLGEAEIIADSAEQTTPPRMNTSGEFDRVGLRHVEAIVDASHPSRELAAHGHAGADQVGTAVHRGQAASFLGRNAEGCVGHAQRLEQAFA